MLNLNASGDISKQNKCYFQTSKGEKWKQNKAKAWDYLKIQEVIGEEKRKTPWEKIQNKI